jgi:hypothetical protein
VPSLAHSFAICAQFGTGFCKTLHAIVQTVQNHLANCAKFCRRIRTLQIIQTNLQFVQNFADIFTNCAKYCKRIRNLCEIWHAILQFVRQTVFPIDSGSLIAPSAAHGHSSTVGWSVGSK